MKRFLSIFAMLLLAMVAFAENDVGKYEAQNLDLPTVTINATQIQTPVVCEYEFHNYSATVEYAVIVEDNEIPSPKVYPVPKYMLSRHYITATPITNWRHRSHVNSMNLRYTNSTYKR